MAIPYRELHVINLLCPIIYDFILPISHNSYLQACTGLYDPSFRSYAHDLRLLLLRFAYENSFSAESGGGGPRVTST